MNVTAHAAGFEDMWLVSATPEQLGLAHNHGSLHPISCSPVRATCGDSPHCDSFDGVKMDILRSMRAAGVGFRCIVVRPRGHSAARGDVQPSWRCYEGAEVLEVKPQRNRLENRPGGERWVAGGGWWVVGGGWRLAAGGSSLRVPCGDRPQCSLNLP